MLRFFNTTRYITIVGLILLCFTNVLFAQTFQYSRGWTNGRKRTPSLLPVTEQSEPEIVGIYSIMKLRKILEHRHRSQGNLPCETLRKQEDSTVSTGDIKPYSFFDPLSSSE